MQAGEELRGQSQLGGALCATFAAAQRQPCQRLQNKNQTTDASSVRRCTDAANANSHFYR